MTKVNNKRLIKKNIPGKLDERKPKSVLFQITKMIVAVARKCSIKKVLSKMSKNSCAAVSFLIVEVPQTETLIKNETQVHEFSCEFFEIFKNTFL